jgi:uncharacterized protein YciI
MKIHITDEIVQNRIATGRHYCLGLYKAGPRRDQPPEEQKQIQAAHLRYLFQLRADGKLLISGPVLDDAVLKGVSIFNTTDIEEVKRLSEADPAVQAGRLVYEIHPWFGIPGDSLPE